MALTHQTSSRPFCSPTPSNFQTADENVITANHNDVKSLRAQTGGTDLAITILLDNVRKQTTVSRACETGLRRTDWNNWEAKEKPGNIRPVCLDYRHSGTDLILIPFVSTYEGGPIRMWRYPISLTSSPVCYGSDLCRSHRSVNPALDNNDGVTDIRVGGGCRAALEYSEQLLRWRWGHTGFFRAPPEEQTLQRTWERRKKKKGIKGLFLRFSSRNAAHMAMRQTQQLVTALMKGKLHLVGPPSDALHISILMPSGLGSER